MNKQKLIDYMLDRVIMPITRGSCWEYTSGREKTGYCRVMVNYKRWGAHRLMWTLAVGKIPRGKFLCHKCDNPPCINPNHLFLGDQRDNAVDCVKKGRHKAAKLKPADVVDIRKRIKIGKESLRSIAHYYGIDHMGISEIRDGLRWSHVG